MVVTIGAQACRGGRRGQSHRNHLFVRSAFVLGLEAKWRRPISGWCCVSESSGNPPPFFFTEHKSDVLNLVQDLELQKSLSVSGRTSSNEDISQAIPEEEEHVEEDAQKNARDDDDAKEDKDESEMSMPDSPVMQNNSLPVDNAMFREVTVTGGDWWDGFSDVVHERCRDECEHDCQCNESYM